MQIEWMCNNWRAVAASDSVGRIVQLAPVQCNFDILTIKIMPSNFHNDGMCNEAIFTRENCCHCFIQALSSHANHIWGSSVCVCSNSSEAHCCTLIQGRSANTKLSFLFYTTMNEMSGLISIAMTWSNWIRRPSLILPAVACYTN